MRQITEDDALIGLLSAVILQAVEDYEKLKRHRAIDQSGVPAMHRFGRRLGMSRSYHHIDGFRHGSEAQELIEFLCGSGLDLLCDLTGHPACRIRRKLGIRNS